MTKSTAKTESVIDMVFKYFRDLLLQRDGGLLAVYTDHNNLIGICVGNARFLQMSFSDHVITTTSSYPKFSQMLEDGTTLVPMWATGSQSFPNILPKRHRKKLIDNLKYYGGPCILSNRAKLRKRELELLAYCSRVADTNQSDYRDKVNVDIRRYDIFDPESITKSEFVTQRMISIMRHMVVAQGRSVYYKPNLDTSKSLVELAEAEYVTKLVNPRRKQNA